MTCVFEIVVDVIVDVDLKDVAAAALVFEMEKDVNVGVVVTDVGLMGR